MMKKVVLPILFLSSAVMYSCNNTPDAHKADASDSVAVTQNSAVDGIKYSLNPQSSSVTWTGSKPIGSNHTGTIAIKSGTLTTNANKEILNGSFVIDMNSITVTDIKEADKNAKLTGHLKNEDFFEVNKYPEAKFEITGVAVASDADKLKFKDATHMISGNLTMKDVTKNLSIPAKVTITDTQIEAVSEFNFDRTIWNVSFNSNPAAEGFINKDVNIKMNIVATKG